MKKTAKIAGGITLIALIALIFAGCDNGTTEKWVEIDNPAQLYGTWKGSYSIKNINDVYDFTEALEEEGVDLGDTFKNITIGGSFDIALKIEPDPSDDPDLLQIGMSGSSKITVTGDMNDTGFQVMIVLFALLAETSPDDIEIEFWNGNTKIDPEDIDENNAAGINKIAITIPLDGEPESVSFGEFSSSGIKINENGTRLWLPANDEFGNQKSMILIRTI